MIKLVPSILSADILHLEDQIKIVEKNGADSIHVDVMDGNFVPNITFGPVIVSTLKRITKLPLDVHLMIMNPDRYIDQFIDAGANILTIPQEVGGHLHRTLKYINDRGCQSGVSINPATSIMTIEPVFKHVDYVLVMTVNPGFGGQEFIHTTLDKFKDLVKIRNKNNYKFQIAVDGGINMDTVSLVVKAGAEILVAGDATFGQKNIGEACRKLKEIAISAQTG
jgi:ribulose-phosphate 3-epimerase